VHEARARTSLAVLASLLAACGGNGTAKDEAQATVTASVSPSPMTALQEINPPGARLTVALMPSPRTVAAFRIAEDAPVLAERPIVD